MHNYLSEVFRYLGVSEPVPDELRQQVSDIAQRLSSVRPRFVYKVCSLVAESDALQIPEVGLSLSGQLARKMLSDCDQVILLACTLGIPFDATLRAEQARSMSNAVILNACGNVLVESGCDAAEDEIKARFPSRFLTDRFSPGYGDLPLDLQPALCAALDTGRRLGLHVSSSYLMNPSKSVTALIGLSDRPQMARIRGCAYCAMRADCSLRKGGKYCAP